MFQRVNGILMNTVSFGTGPRTLVAQGGWTGGWEVWQQPFELLGSRWRCVAFDHRGCGETVVPPETITADAMVDDLVGVLDGHGVDRCVLAGESMGTVIALLAAQRHPERFAGLVLVAATPAVRRDAVRGLVAGARTDYPATVRAFVDACVPEPASEHLRRWGRHMLERAEPESAARLLEAMYDVEPDLSAITLPVAVVHGTADAIVPIGVGRALADALPDATFHELDGVGHVPTVTAPELVAAVVEQRFGRDAAAPR